MKHPYPEEARHDWRAIVGYRLTDEQAYRLAAHSDRPGAPPLVPIHPAERPNVDPLIAVLDVDQVDQAMSHILCLRCEVAHADAHSLPCPGEPVGYAGSGGPVYEVRNLHGGEVRRIVWREWLALYGDADR